MSQGIYISVPFCRTKCSFCNFASGVFSRAIFERYVQQLCSDITSAHVIGQQLGCFLDQQVDSVYFGGGTPSVLAPDQLERILRAVRETFEVEPAAEITVECAPGTIGEETLEALARRGVNRISLGVQSFVDKECSSVGRLHSRAITVDDIARIRALGIGNISIDLIAGLPHQTADSWELSLSDTLATGVPHVSVYTLEVDEDSRLGTELLAGGNRYHAHFVPDDDLTADLYLAACKRLDKGGVRQYEISNFARPVTHGIGLRESRHNLKYWTRQPYLGFGVDAHSMLSAGADLEAQGIGAVRFATADSLDAYLQPKLSVTGCPLPVGDPVSVNHTGWIVQMKSSRTLVDKHAALEESFFLGLRLNRGVSIGELRARFGDMALDDYASVIAEQVEAGLLGPDGDRIKLTARGRLLSNEVFASFLRKESLTTEPSKARH